MLEHDILSRPLSSGEEVSLNFLRPQVYRLSEWGGCVKQRVEAYRKQQSNHQDLDNSSYLNNNILYLIRIYIQTNK